MGREPSIHITKGNLIKILRDIYTIPGTPLNLDINAMANDIMKRARPYSISSRSITVSNDRIEKVANKIIGSSRADAAVFARLIYAIRKGRRHRGILPIQPGSKDWTMVKQIAGNALDFQNEFGIISRKDAFTKYINTAIDITKNFHLNKFSTLYTSICNRYQAVSDIANDNDKEMTANLYKAFNRIIISNTGILEHYENLPEKYVWFVKAREQAEEMNISVDLYIKAQFEALDFAKGIPHPAQLIGDKARDRVIRYMFKNNIKV